MQSPKTCLGAVIKKMMRLYEKSSTRIVGNVRDVPGTLRQKEDSSNPRPHTEENERVLVRSRVVRSDRWRCLGGRTSKTQCSAWVRDIKRGTHAAQQTQPPRLWRQTTDQWDAATKNHLLPTCRQNDKNAYECDITTLSLPCF